ncbi:alpha/beta hydrolase [Pseudomarimonas arenosa]|uniref:Alpha/beta fold hydrolase n=1 Tax=Pseudomarimonas arenosa TaxID=2774145 RepID=A0AAW3ZLN3_9GAMM|nr:alpha/beta hydrolase [Pseudomarimonas arenosa]MBD8526370.1 alpha/beta fold hydrolase [Pseudomarimonas arenosa]
MINRNQPSPLGQPTLARRSLTAAMLLSVSALACAADPATLRRQGNLDFEPCALHAGNLPYSIEAYCTEVEVAEDRSNPESRRISLGLAWVPASGDAEPDPIVMLAGGPGQAAKQAYPMVNHAFRDARRNRDVFLLDARGTGDSNPLVCRNAAGVAAITESAEDDPNQAGEFARRCVEALSQKADLRFYGTSEHIDDLDEVRQRLAIEKINLIGISYGTRVAQQYAARYPEHTRTVVLDAVVPNTLVLGAEHARNLEDALNQQFERCVEAGGCAEKLGNPREQLTQVRALLEQGELEEVSYRDSTSGLWQKEKPAFGHLALLLRMYAYSQESATALPYLIHEASEGRYADLLAQARALVGNLTDQLYHGMQLSVSCTEDADDLSESSADDGTVMGPEFIAFTKAQCAVWPRGTRDPNFRQPLSNPELPVLVLSGEFDPVTPPRYGEEVVQHLPKGRHLIMKGQGHGAIGLGCMPKLYAQFLETADAKALKPECLGRLKPLPPFAGVYGWEP